MIIDCHGHYTTAPAGTRSSANGSWRWFADRSLPDPTPTAISDDEIRETIEKNQLKLQKQRGADLTLFSPRASAMGHHEGDEAVSLAWTRACNDLIERVVDLYPDNFVGVCQLPQSPGVPIAGVDRRAQALRHSNWASSAATSIPIPRAATGRRRR